LWGLCLPKKGALGQDPRKKKSEMGGPKGRRRGFGQGPPGNGKEDGPRKKEENSLLARGRPQKTFPAKAKFNSREGGDEHEMV